ncbi:hypothetical protein MXB_11 [Myxobolus squamalis]|nr:hypothetical protein MXB_11 [Myxobolus squamalis]
MITEGKKKCVSEHNECASGHCNGKSPKCNLIVTDELEEITCNKGMSMCTEKLIMCKYIWNWYKKIFLSGSYYDTLTCFNEFNAKGNDFGNCGEDKNGPKKCMKDDVLCGKIICKIRHKRNNNFDYSTIGNCTYKSIVEKKTKYRKSLMVPDGIECGHRRVCATNIYSRCVLKVNASTLKEPEIL